MAIKHKVLKEYIFANSTSAIRGRGKEIRIEDHEFSKDKNIISASVLGSGGNKYHITLKGLVKGPIIGSCTCPYDWGLVCKHQVAVANALDGLLASENQLVLLPEMKASTKETKYSSIEPIVIPFPDFNKSLDDFFKKNLSTALLNSYRRLAYGLEAKLINDGFAIDKKVLEFECISTLTYRAEKNHSIKISKKENTLSLECDCSQKNQYLCRHQMKALEYLMDHLVPWLWDDDRLTKEKQIGLKEYGFNILDDYQEHFDFGMKDNKLHVLPKKTGVLKLVNYQRGLDTLIDGIVTGEEVELNELPLVYPAQQRKKQMIIGFAIACYAYHSSIGSFKIIPVRGNVKKDGALSNSIYEINSDYYYADFSLLTEEENEIVHSIIKCFRAGQENKFSVIESIKFLIPELKAIIPELNQYPLFEFRNYYTDSYSYQREKISPKKLAKLDALHVLEDQAFHFLVTEEPRYFVVEALVDIEEKTYSLVQENIRIQSAFLIKDTICYLLNSVTLVKAMHAFKDNAELRIPKDEFLIYYRKILQPLSQKYTVKIPFMPKRTIIIDKKDVQCHLYLSEIQGFILMKPVMDYLGKQVEALNKATIQSLEKGKIEVLQRETKVEDQFITLLKELHPEFSNQGQTFFHLSPEQFVEDMWFLNAFEKLKKNNIKIFGYDNLSTKKYSLHKPSINIHLSSEQDWFEVNVEVAFGDMLISLKDVQKSIINKSKYIELDDGTLGVIPEHWLEKYAHLFRTGTIKNGKVRVSKYQFSIIDSLYDDLDKESPIIEQHKEIKKRLQTFDQIEKIKKPRGLKATLRDYQKEGLNWLSFLDEYNFGGCLADDMGLGKTLQIITFLKHIKNTVKPEQANLVVVPTSLIFNWQEEIEKFCPTLKIVVHTTGNRVKKISAFKNQDIVLTTYGIVMRDIEFIKKYHFHYIILDESQAIKNPNSQRFKAMRLLKSTNKLVLTGTPIENNTFDLYAQMSFVNPGLLGTMAHFKKHFSTPIDKNKDIQVAKELRALINPFLMRRTKEQVAKDLPEKTEQVLYCAMAEDQQKLYDAYRNKYRDYLLGKIEEDGIGKSKMYVLEGLTKLRQICDAPQLLNDDGSYTNESVKITELLNHITEKTGNHKILVFSQFVKMLSLIQKKLDALGIQYEYLDGKTKDRQARVDNFQNNDATRVFLISLKAGGTGLNLTAADYVYLVDPWWNPAVEAQAIDRCYRIGQTKNVMAYKMICKGTIEEKIIKYQEKKKQVSSDIIQTDESFVKSLSKESIADLFS